MTELIELLNHTSEDRVVWYSLVFVVVLYIAGLFIADMVRSISKIFRKDG